MRELNMMEIEAVSGAGFLDTVGAITLGALVGLSVGTVKGGVAGGSVGGILGFGLISAGVTMVIGMVYGTVIGGIFGMVNGWNTTAEYFNEVVAQWFDLSLPVPKV
ncbi:hypothetical protein NG99_04890 [Erwinia typographi]|uniref:DUF5862 domain-containing protein n=1 Tax=Erwinia typographi TaxID=371042 RepID=A0A0A3Z830_9GAMM|nr:hypothetical protein [Erwinia typographi]KGT94985.1 hypothetical protein NG99_04890 [Erwinia typographi]